MKRYEKEIGGVNLVFETGKLAKQANGSVIVKAGGTTVLVTACMEYKAKENLDFFPLTVNYQEKFYAAGKFPGGFMKRETRPGNREVLTARLIDRPIRPLFADGFRHETQIIATVLSVDDINTPDVLAMNGASLALSISDIPFLGPIGAVKVGYVNDELVLNPSNEDLENSAIDITISGSKKGIMMVEGLADLVSEDLLLEALEFGHKYIVELVELQEQIQQEIGKEKIRVTPEELPEDLVAELKEKYYSKMTDAIFISGKNERKLALRLLWDEIAEDYAAQIEEDGSYAKLLSKITSKFNKEIIRQNIINEQKRIGGRSLTDIRDITCEIDMLPSTHGAALFTRGETQSLAVVTLGTKRDKQIIDDIEGDRKERFTLHYNFPPYSVGEVGFLRAPGRREIGHGTLAKRALSAVLPDEEKFPYTVRVVSEILESNGSSSMASVCCGSLALMTAGVPTSAPVAGIAMGLIKEDDRFFVLSDILGDEDHCGDMDFKIAGTKDGVSAIQMDIKIDSVTFDIMKTALNQAKEGRLHILGKMGEAISNPKDDIAPSAPRIVSITIPKDKIKDLIGPGGKNIKAIVEEAEVDIDIDDDGTVNVASANKDNLDKGLELIKMAVKEVEVGEVYDGVVKNIMKFGAFIELFPGCDGLLHISELDEGYVEKVEDYLSIGQQLKVKVIGIDDRGKISLKKEI